MDIRIELEAVADKEYRDFQSKLLPNVPKEIFLGVRTPDIRKLAKKLIKSGEADRFLSAVPHELFDENQLHSLTITEIKDIDKALEETDKFLPYVDNWATCDQLNPRSFKGRQKELLPHIKRWINSGKCYTTRFGMKMLMMHYLGEHFKHEYLEWVASVQSEEYYVKMMQAWFFAEALAQQYDAALSYITEAKLSPWVSNKAIQKAKESLKIPEDRKTYLSGFKRKMPK
ncbi:DNA alkylation repair protein [Ruminococcus albus]|uniref:3-methyladenine DNA glycosylase AlkD n=1 Tax=Ruminococcus albus TaxID=1264 RepID=A0A1I1KTW6_RUMAL|nr:DNA alkylation repair protein [Ruminococcus albus]SFC63712.1 3-methyladenine DNA glycosylase AlkD [Ruminococcus albus]